MTVGKYDFVDKNGKVTVKYYFSFDIQKKPRKQYRKEGFKTKREALAEEEKAYNKFKDGEALKKSRLKFRDAGQIYINHIESKYKKETADKYGGFLKNHLQTFLDMQIDDIIVYDVNKWINWQLSEENDNRISETLVNDCLKMCKAMLS